MSPPPIYPSLHSLLPGLPIGSLRFRERILSRENEMREKKSLKKTAGAPQDQRVSAAPGSIPGPAQWLKGSSAVTAMALLAASVWIQPLTQEFPYVTGTAIHF